MPNKPATFSRAYSLKYGIKVAERDPMSGNASSYSCMFCEFFGRDDDAETESSRKRRRTSRTKFFKKRFYTQNVVKHHETQHSIRWDKYKSLSNLKKGKYFASTPVKNTLLSHLETIDRDQIRGEVSVSIVDKLIGDMFVNDDDDDSDLTVYAIESMAIDGVGNDTADSATTKTRVETARDRALKPFSLQSCEDVDDNELNGDVACYTFRIPNSMLFGLVVDYVAAGMSFRLTSQAINVTRDRIGVGSVGSVNPLKVASIVRVVCADSFQSLSDTLRNVWCFSVAMDMATHQGSSYLDIRVRIPGMSKSENFHTAIIPFSASHTGRNMANQFCKLFDVLCPDWRRKLLSIATDGAANMTGTNNGVAKLIADECENRVIRIWCGAHQLDLCIQRFFKQLLGSEGSFYDRLNAVIGYLRRQYGLQAQMGCQCPKVATTRWLSMVVVLSWFARHYHTLTVHFEEKRPSCIPTPEWWVQVHTVYSIAARANITFKSLQDANLTLSQQRNLIFDLEQFLADRFKVRDINDIHGCCEIGGLDSENIIVHGDWVASTQVIAKDFEDRCIGDGVDWNDDLNEDQRHEISVSYTKAILQLTAEVHNLQTSSMQIDTGNIDCADSPLTPQEILERPSQFRRLLREFKDRLRTVHQTLGDDSIWLHLINHEAQELKTQHRAIDVATSREFELSWSPKLRERFPNLFKFCCGLSTIFPGTSTVESDFSIVNYEKNNRRTGLSDLALQGIVHCKQYERLRHVVQSFRTDSTDQTVSNQD